MSKARRALIVMAKKPRAGDTKTRLMPHLTPEEAALLYECLLLDTLDLARAVPEVVPYVAVSPVEAAAYFHRIAPDVAQVPQQGESLGERLDNVLTTLLTAGFGQVAAVASDVPTLPVSHVTQAFERLADDTVDVVLGPSEDGGYHLIAWKRPHPRLVREVQMSTPKVLKDTLDLAAADRVRVALLPGWHDVDVPADLDRLEVEVRQGAPLHRHTRRFFERRAVDGGRAPTSSDNSP